VFFDKFLPRNVKRQVKGDFLLALSKQASVFETNPLSLDENSKALSMYWLIIIPKTIFEGMFLNEVKGLPIVRFDNKEFPISLAYITQAFVLFQLREIVHADIRYFNLFDGNLLEIITELLESAYRNGAGNCLDVFSQLRVYDHFIELEPYYREKSVVYYHDRVSELLSDKNHITGDSIIHAIILNTYYTFAFVEFKKYSDILVDKILVK